MKCFVFFYLTSSIESIVYHPLRRCIAFADWHGITFCSSALCRLCFCCSSAICHGNHSTDWIMQNSKICKSATFENFQEENWQMSVRDETTTAAVFLWVDYGSPNQCKPKSIVCLYAFLSVSVWWHISNIHFSTLWSNGRFSSEEHGKSSLIMQKTVNVIDLCSKSKKLR